MELDGSELHEAPVVFRAHWGGVGGVSACRLVHGMDGLANINDAITDGRNGYDMICYDMLVANSQIGTG